MSDFNTMFDEQVSIKESADSTQRILEAMLKRDSLEIEYRQKGIDESKIAEFHEKATKNILEAAEGMKNAANAVKNGVGAVIDSNMELVQSVWDKIVKFAKKVWNWIVHAFYTIRNLFANDQKFIERYRKELMDAGDKCDGIKVTVYSTDPNANYLRTSEWSKKSAEEWNKAAEEAKNVEFGEGTKYIGKNITIKQIIDGFTEDINRINIIIKNNEADIAYFDKLEKKPGVTKEDGQKMSAFVKAKKAEGAWRIKLINARHKAYKSAIVRCVSNLHSVKESTIEFMVESACSELDRAYPVLESEVVTEGRLAKKIYDAAKEKLAKKDDKPAAKKGAKKVSEAAEEVTPLLDTAASQDSQGVTDVNLASTEVLPQGASNDPNALEYDKKDCFSQTVNMGDEGVAGTVGAELGDTETEVKSGNETPSVKEESFDFATEMAELDAMLAE